MFQGLTLNEVRVLVTTQPRKELTDWMVWMEGWDIWKELLEIDRLIAPLKRDVEGPIPKVGNIRTGTVTDSEIVSPDMAHVERDFKDLSMAPFVAKSELDVEVLESKGSTGGILRRFVKRNFTRYKKRLKIHIAGKEGQSFTSFSKDISVGGILLTEPLPRWVVGYLQVKIVDKQRKQAIEVTCSVVEDQDPNYRVRLEILPLQKKEEELHFDKWLAA